MRLSHRAFSLCALADGAKLAPVHFKLPFSPGNVKPTDPHKPLHASAIKTPDRIVGGRNSYVDSIPIHIGHANITVLTRPRVGRSRRSKPYRPSPASC